MGQTRAVDWIIVGPEPYLANCQRCGAHVAKPELPVSIDEFLRLLRAVEREHSACTYYAWRHD